MPKKPSLDSLNAELTRAAKMLDASADAIKELDLLPRGNVRQCR